MEYNSLFENRPVEYGTLPVKLVRFTREPGGRVVKLHWHGRLEMMVVDQGEMDLQLAGREVHAEKGDIVIINCSATHTGFAGPEGVSYRVIMFELLEPFAYNEAMKRLLLPYCNFGAAFLPLIRDARISEIADRLFEERRKKEEAYELVVTGLCFELLGILVRQYTDGEFVRLTDNHRMRAVLDHIEEHFQERLTTEGISKAFGYDKAYFCRRFKVTTGLTLTTYVRILRLEKARRLLKEPAMTVAAVASACGFPDQNYFTRCFKAHYGKSPTAYLRSLNQQ
ncbi:MAG: helix-turn-helix transcriptional regulator [Clostridia bacterium]|nr:helix-turn-helix transcriptional regulator [Clostridia bacterium]